MKYRLLGFGGKIAAWAGAAEKGRVVMALAFEIPGYAFHGVRLTPRQMEAMLVASHHPLIYFRGEGEPAFSDRTIRTLGWLMHPSDDGWRLNEFGYELLRRRGYVPGEAWRRMPFALVDIVYDGYLTDLPVRRVAVTDVSRWAMAGYCHQRNGECRCYGLSQVVRAVDVETGEVIVNLHEWLLDKRLAGHVPVAD